MSLKVIKKDIPVNEWGLPVIKTCYKCKARISIKNLIEYEKENSAHYECNKCQKATALDYYDNIWRIVEIVYETRWDCIILPLICGAV